MSERRMFSKTIIDSDVFLDMPLSTQALYFHLSMRADDDGFVNSPKRIQRTIGCNDDDLKLLCAKQFIIPFESGIVVIKHWKIHNYIQKDRYKETVYLSEKSTIELSENGVYTPCIQNGDTGKVRLELGKVSLGEDIEEEKTSNKKYDYSFYQETYNRICSKLPKCQMLNEKRKQAIRKFEKEYTKEQFETICQNVNVSDWHTGNNNRKWKANIDFILRVDKAVTLLEYTRDSKYCETTEQDELPY